MSRTEPSHVPASDHESEERPLFRRPVSGAIAGGLAVTTLLAGGFLLFDRREPQTGPFRTAPVSRADVDQTVELTGAVKRLSAVLVTPPAPGVVEEVSVKVGDQVKAGQVLATLNTKAAREALTKAQAKVVQARAGAVAPPAPSGADGSGELRNAQRAAKSARNAVNAAAGARERARVACSSLADTARIDQTPPQPARVPRAPEAPAPAAPTSVPTSVPRSVPTSVPKPAPTEAPSKAPSKAPAGPAAPDQGSSQRSAPSAAPSRTAAAPQAGRQQASEPRRPAGTTADAAPEPRPTQEAAPSAARSSESAPHSADNTDSTPRTSPAGTPSASGLRMEPMSLTRPLTAAGASGAVKAEPSERQVQACVDALAAAMASDRNASGQLTGLSTELERASAQIQRMSATADRAALAARAGSNASLAAIVKAEAELAMAQQAVNGGTLVAGIAGEVTSVDLAKGEAALPGQGIGIAGKGAAELIVNVPLARVGLLKVGQAATVEPPGGGKTLAGRITAIETAPSENGSLAPLYPVHVTVSDAPTSLGTGAIATASIKVASVDGVKTVPVSALAGFTGGKGTVQVMVDGSTTERPVEVGAVGQGRAEIRSGLKYGETVVLADPAAELPNDLMDDLPFPRPSSTG